MSREAREVATELWRKAIAIVPKGSGVEGLIYRGLTSLLSPFEDPTGLDRPLWRDWSRWQWPLNIGAAVVNGVLGGIHRAGVSWGYVDPYISQFLQQVSPYVSNGFFSSTYHVIYADQSITNQADRVWYAVQPEPMNFPRVIDLEVDRGVSGERVADATWNMSELVLSRDGMRPAIYTRKNLVDVWLAPYWTTEMLNEHKWWFAQYLFDTTREHPGPPDRPVGILEENVWLHQTASKKTAFQGESGGTTYADWDRWELGDAEQMGHIIATYMGTDVPPPPPPTHSHPELEIRVNEVDNALASVMANIVALTEEVEANQNTIANHEFRLATLEESGNTGTPATVDYYVTADDKAVGHIEVGTNESGKMILDLPEKNRVKYLSGETTKVYPARIDVNGPWDAWESAQHRHTDGSKLYFIEKDGHPI